MKLNPTTIVARFAFYLAILALGSSALTVNFPEWQKIGITGDRLLQLANTLLLVSIAMILAAGHDERNRDKG